MEILAINSEIVKILITEQIKGYTYSNEQEVK